MIFIFMECVQGKIGKKVRSHSNLAIVIFSIGFEEMQWRQVQCQDEEDGYPSL